MTSLAEKLSAASNPAEMLRHSPIGTYVYPVVASEFSNWRDEQRAWRESAVLFDQSHHMDELIVEGPDAANFLEGLAINSFAGFGMNRAKHYVSVSTEGYVIGDMIAFREREDRFVLVGRAPVANWLEFNHAAKPCKVRLTRSHRSPSRPDGQSVSRVHYRFQIQGPDAPKIFEQLHREAIPEIKFFHVDQIRVGSKVVQALRHGMAGAPGLEIWGPYDEKPYILSTILQAAEDAGVDLRRVGSRAYATNTLESGWIPSPLPAIYSGDGLMRDYREWLPADGYEATCSIGGSFVSDDIRDYYTYPSELGYGFYVKFDHKFIGHDALKSIDGIPGRRRVTFEWNSEDVGKVIMSAFQPGKEPYKWLDLPLSNYSSSGFDRIMSKNQLVGLSMFAGYSYNERCMLSLGMVNAGISVGDELTLIWGEPNGGTRKSSIERHRQAEIRVRVSPTPFSKEARENYAESWRTKSNLHRG